MNAARYGHPLEDLAVYAVDGLDPDERLAVERHLDTCPTCRADVDEHRATLGLLTGDEAPPPVVWERIVDDVAARGLTSRDGRPGPPAPPAPRRPRPDSWPPAPPIAAGDGAGPPVPPEPPVPGPPPVLRPANLRDRRSQRLAGAALAVAAVVAAIVGLAGGLAPDTGETDIAALAERAGAEGGTIGVLRSPQGAEVARVVSGAPGTYIQLDDLDPLAGGRVYQLWRLDGPAPVSLGILGDGSAEAVAVRVPEPTIRLAITAEPPGGSATPTAPLVASGRVTTA